MKGRSKAGELLLTLSGRAVEEKQSGLIEGEDPLGEQKVGTDQDIEGCVLFHREPGFTRLPRAVATPAEQHLTARCKALALKVDVGSLLSSLDILASNSLKAWRMKSNRCLCHCQELLWPESIVVECKSRCARAPMFLLRADPLDFRPLYRQIVSDLCVLQLAQIMLFCKSPRSGHSVPHQIIIWISYGPGSCDQNLVIDSCEAENPPCGGL